jgi:hypothetical protein
MSEEKGILKHNDVTLSTFTHIVEDNCTLTHAQSAVWYMGTDAAGKHVQFTCRLP